MSNCDRGRKGFGSGRTR
uniref:Uncharacterized protein n=1 Tax=Arundo donax TaxID=35708 RepID=A0A0A9EXN4_ARUDO